MRTTLDIDADVLKAAKEIAANRQTSVAKLFSEWARQALAPRMRPRTNVRNGVPPLARQPGAPKRTLELVNRLRDEL